MTATDVLIVSTGTANVASVVAALRRAGATPRAADGADEIRTARRVILPGVGTFAAAMAHLTRTGAADALRERTEAGMPLLAICLGMQMLAATSEESAGVDGIGAIDAPVVRLPPPTRVPQLGWIEVTPTRQDALVTTGHAYFANSYCLAAHDGSWSPVYAVNGAPFLAAIERGPQLACQFHPELSGRWGTALIGRWLDAC
jgi:glutamine amidotransferase